MQLPVEPKPPELAGAERGTHTSPPACFLPGDPTSMTTRVATVEEWPRDRAVQVVVAAAVVRSGRLLAARRTAPPAAAGRWELPGGKVEVGETAEDALVREIHEELGCTVRPVGWLGIDSPIRPGLVLRAARVDLVSGEPDPREHDEVRWLAGDELDDVDWLDADRPFLAPLREILAP